MAGTTPTALIAPLRFLPAGLNSPTSTAVTEASYFAIMAEELCRLDSGGDPSDDEALDEREAELFCRMADDSLNGKIAALNADKGRQAFLDQLKLDKEGYFEDLKAYYEQGGTSEPYIVAFPDTPVKYNGSRDQWFIDLPAAFVNLPRYRNLPREQFATVECMRVSDRGRRSYIPMAGTTSQFFIGAHPSGFQGNVGTSREGAILWLVLPPGVNAPDAKVLLKVVIRTRDETLLPDPGYLAAASWIDTIGLAWNLWKGRSAPDKHNDANDQRGRA